MASDPTVPQRREDTLILPNGTFLYLLAGDSGKVQVFVGPIFHQGLKAIDTPVKWDPLKRAFVECASLRDATQTFAFIPDGSYAILTNPTAKGVEASPRIGSISAPADLHVGLKSVMKGPSSFPLWPQQEAVVIAGHHLQPNNYLLLTVTNEEEARKNWRQAVLVSQATPVPTDQTSTQGQREESSSAAPPIAGVPQVDPSQKPPQTISNGSSTPSGVRPDDLVMGKNFILKGTEASFFIPPTGVEVVPDSPGQYVRTAETLASMEFCILRDVNGVERYVRGPATVFPLPTEEFVVRDNSRKFRAIELNSNMGIHVKVIEAYTDDNGQSHNVGDEVFITGRTQAIFWPRREIVVVKYGSGDSEYMHFAVAVPAGEGRYVLDKDTGEVDLVEGPEMLLLEPMKKVFVQRALPPSLVKLLYPGNEEAVEINRRLSEIAASKLRSEPLLQSEALGTLTRGMSAFAGEARSLSSVPPLESPGSTVTRRQAFTPPRSVRLDADKYSGAIGLTVFNQYAVLVTDSSGHQRVEVGPTRVLLEYDETVMPVTLSTGTPKSDDKPIQTAYLRIRNTRISDSVRATTSDLCEIDIRLSYRVDFTGEDDESRLKWFAVENPIQFLVEHLRSILRSIVRDRGIQEFYATATNLIRDGILGTAVQGQKRPGKLFAENGMLVTDVEVLAVTIVDRGIGDLLTKAQQGSVERAVKQLGDKQALDAAIEAEERQRLLAKAKTETATVTADLEIVKAVKTGEVEGTKLEVATATQLSELESLRKTTAERQANEAAAEKQRLESKQDAQVIQNRIDELRREAEKATMDLRFAEAERTVAQVIKRMEADDKSLADRMKAMTPDLISAMMQVADEALMTTLTESLAPLAIVGGTSVAEVAAKFFKGTPLESVMTVLGSRLANRPGAVAQA